jgi:hypothetical protein
MHQEIGRASPVLPNLVVGRAIRVLAEMTGVQIRSPLQVIPALFGPGSLHTDPEGVPLVVGGLDHWFSRSYDWAARRRDKCLRHVRERIVCRPQAV